MTIVYPLYVLQKAVNVPVNAISPTSANHLHDKFFKLSRLISGQLVETGHGKIAATTHPEGIAFCKNLLAQKFVVSILVTGYCVHCLVKFIFYFFLLNVLELRLPVVFVHLK